MNFISRISNLRFILAAVAASMLAAHATADWKQVDERWYIVELAGAQAGTMVERVHSDGERYRMENEVKLSISRGAVSTDIEMRSSYLETLDGRPLTIRYVQEMASQSVDTEWRFEGDQVIQTTRQAGRELVKEHPLPAGRWLTPMAVHRYWLERREAGADQITYRTVDPQAGLQPIMVTQKLVGEGTYEFDGRPIPVTVWESTTDLMPIVAKEQYSSDGYLVHQELVAGFGKMVTRIATRAEAQADAGPAPEVLIKTFVEPDRPIPNVMKSTTATLNVELKEGSMPTLPSAGAQKFKPGPDDGTATLTIDTSVGQPVDLTAKQGAPYLDASAMIDVGDPVIQALAAKAVRGAGSDPLERAEAMRAFVHTFVNEKGLDTAFATASETAQLRAGDCSEHAVLLCAMLRAEGIPARVAIGLIYTDSFLGREGIFGWHMWTQALIDGRWVDLDATLPRRYHAGHVLTGVSALGEGALAAELASSITLMGNLRIEVVDVGYE
ncbi:MAG: transglutaminase-like domain-containing protein [Planctomycetota bacterium]|jgi:transglutaminase-like putative cysteine protease